MYASLSSESSTTLGKMELSILSRILRCSLANCINSAFRKSVKRSSACFWHCGKKYHYKDGDSGNVNSDRSVFWGAMATFMAIS